MRAITVDCANLESEAAFWHAYLEATKPEGAGYFGRNLDAFWDALNGGPGWPGECEIKFTNTNRLRSFRNGAFYEALAEIARDIARESKSVRIHFE